MSNKKPIDKEEMSTKEKDSFSYEDVVATAQFLVSKTRYRPEIGIICGTGLGGLAGILDDADVFNYKDIPGFPLSTVPGHAGRLVFGSLGGKQVVCMQGRFHAYEGYSMTKVTFPVRVMDKLGVRLLVVTNACGGLNPDFNVGDVMLIKDHINLPGLSGCSPLVGLQDDRFGARFTPLSDAYDRRLRKKATEIAKQCGWDFIREGVYVVQVGPCYETVTESRMMRILGGDVAGMSSVPEVIVARQAGIKVLGISLITNMCVVGYDEDGTANHQEVVDVGKKRAKDMEIFVSRLIENIDPKSET